MKKIIATLTMALAINAQAESRYEYCETLSKLAYKIMVVHQMGVPMSKAMNTMADVAVSRVLVKLAYGEPRYTTAEAQERAQGQFRDYIYGKCLRAREEG